MIEEVSSTATIGREKLTTDLKQSSLGVPLPLSLKQILSELSVPCFKVADHNHQECIKLLQDINPDLIVLGDTRILKQGILNIPKDGIINVHPGYLPDVKGNNPYIWSIIYDLPLGCTVHFIDTGVDTGPIIKRQKIFLEREKYFPDLLVEINSLCGELLVDSLKQISSGLVKSINQSELARETSEVRTFRLASPAIKALAVEKLEKGTYLHLVSV
ncbi:formyltransferase family protein [Moorena sp. SIO4G3]|uniref:formyltransferase family protein n=1 Tax=Moorena sp. SIO4G3 TaxID=2607821 RepID=UPI00142C7B56|nr:formyltransferase family protein [Moorena sp. SIO4G3]NEO78801.1 hypothetical protein [Moorena sp. SIO4G3]